MDTAMHVRFFEHATLPRIIGKLNPGTLTIQRKIEFLFSCRTSSIFAIFIRNVRFHVVPLHYIFENHFRGGTLEEENLNIPNVLSSCRIAVAPVLLWCVFTGHVKLFTWLLLAALISDIADGVIARMFQMQTKLGAVLDSTGDMATYISAVTGIFVFKFDFIRSHWLPIAVILTFYVMEKISAYLRYSRILNAFHTYLSKSTAYAQGAFVMSLFLFGFKWYFFYPAMALGVIANIEEIILARLLPRYEKDVKGLYWVLKRKQQQA